MFKHARQVILGLVLSFIVIIATGVVSFIDPFNNGIPWINWLVLSTICIIAIMMSAINVSVSNTEEDYWYGILTILLLWLIIAGMFIGYVLMDYGTNYTSLIWSVYGSFAFMFPLSGMFMYLSNTATPVPSMRRA